MKVNDLVTLTLTLVLKIVLSDFVAVGDINKYLISTTLGHSISQTHVFSDNETCIYAIIFKLNLIENEKVDFPIIISIANTSYAITL